MTALTDLTDYRTKCLSPKLGLSSGFRLVPTTSTAMLSSWLLSTPTGVAPTTAVAPTNATIGALMPYLSDASAQMFLSKMDGVGKLSLPIWFMLVDRLSHQGGLDGTVTTAQTTNLPTAALTRYTSGAGVMPMLEVYTAVGTTATTATVSYTNEAGVSGQTSDTMLWGGVLANRIGSAANFIPLAPGDSGCRAVASVTLGGSTLTAGNFGVTLVRPLAVFLMDNGVAVSSVQQSHTQMSWDAVADGNGQIPELISGACLSMLYLACAPPLAAGFAAFTPQVIAS